MSLAPHSFGPDPWLQGQWDARAAANFILGGAGGGLIAFAALAHPHPATRTVLLLLGLVLVGGGLSCVWFELGRPSRALNVFRNPATSWMSRESWAAVTLFAAAGAVALKMPVPPWLAGVIALLFVLCQARMLQSGRAIPAWRAPETLPLLLTTALVEGGGLYWFASLWHRGGSAWLLLVFLGLILLRYGIWLLYTHRLEGNRPVHAALTAPGRVLLVGGTLLPLALVLTLLTLPLPMSGQFVLAAFAGASAAVAGAAMKYAIVRRAAFNQGFALPLMPVRGVRAEP